MLVSLNCSFLTGSVGTNGGGYPESEANAGFQTEQNAKELEKIEPGWSGKGE